MDAQQLQEQGKQQVNRHLRADRPAYVIEAAPVAKPVRLQEHDMGPRAIGPVFDHLKAIIAGLQRQESRQQIEKECRIMQRGQPGEPPLQERAIIQRSEEHTSELQSLMRISYAVFCLKKKKQQ